MSTPRKIRCCVQKVTDHGDRVYSIELKPERPVPAFLPGQFLHLALDEYDPSGFWPESRVFSIASDPKERERICIVYSVKGAYTARMESELAEGRGVWIKLPYGEFVVDACTDAVLLAGGTGITAFQAFIEELTAQHPHHVQLLYGARRPELLLGRKAIESKAQSVRQFRPFFFAESVQSAPVPSSEGLDIHPGRINLDILTDCVTGESAIYYLAGPPAMISALTLHLGQRGIPAGRIRIDAWE